MVQVRLYRNSSGNVISNSWLRQFSLVGFIVRILLSTLEEETVNSIMLTWAVRTWSLLLMGQYLVVTVWITKGWKLLSLPILRQVCNERGNCVPPQIKCLLVKPLQTPLLYGIGKVKVSPRSWSSPGLLAKPHNSCPLVICSTIPMNLPDCFAMQNKISNNWYTIYVNIYINGHVDLSLRSTGVTKDLFTRREDRPSFPCKEVYYKGTATLKATIFIYM